MVWVIRKFRPDVMICRFPTTGEGGHGHHTSSAILAQEAFTAAADPKRFPEQLEYVQVWQAKRLLWNTLILAIPIPLPKTNLK
jgi:LmbE family N-acetylglucosaminyl deacetylase